MIFNLTLGNIPDGMYPGSVQGIYLEILDGSNLYLAQFDEEDWEEKLEGKVTVEIVQGRVHSISNSDSSDEELLSYAKLGEIALVTESYLLSSSQFNRVSAEFTKSCRELRKVLGAERHVKVSAIGKPYVVTSDKDGNFDVTPYGSQKS